MLKLRIELEISKKFEQDKFKDMLEKDELETIEILKKAFENGKVVNDI